MNKLNKLGAGKVFSVYWFAMILIIAGGVFAMVYLFYGTPFDVRDLETHILTNKIADCVSYEGRINSNLILSGVASENKSFLEGCNLIFESNEWEEEQYYAEVDFYKLEDLNNPFLEVKKGNSDWIGNCELQQGDKNYKKLARCNEGSFYSVDNANNQYIIKILTIVRKSEKNVKL